MRLSRHSQHDAMFIPGLPFPTRSRGLAPSDGTAAGATTDPPPPYKPSRPQAQELNRGPPTRGQLRNRKHRTGLWTGEHRNKVSMLSVNGPTREESWVSQCRNGSIPKQKSNSIARRVVSRVANKARKVRPVAPAYDYCDDEGRMVPFAFTDGILQREVEHRVEQDTYDWTQDWAWTFTVQCWDTYARECRVWAHFYFNDVSDLLRQGVPWQTAQRLNPLAKITEMENAVHPPWRFTWKLREPAVVPRWAAVIIAHHKDRAVLEHAETPWEFLTTRSGFG